MSFSMSSILGNLPGNAEMYFSIVCLCLTEKNHCRILHCFLKLCPIPQWHLYIMMKLPPQYPAFRSYCFSLTSPPEASSVMRIRAVVCLGGDLRKEIVVNVWGLQEEMEGRKWRTFLKPVTILSGMDWFHLPGRGNWDEGSTTAPATAWWLFLRQETLRLHSFRLPHDEVEKTQRRALMLCVIKLEGIGADSSTVSCKTY